MAKTRETPTNPLVEALDAVGDRWTLLVVAALLDGPRRFGDLQKALDGIAPNVLTQRLRPRARRRAARARRLGRAPPRRRRAPAPRGVRDADGVALVLPDLRAPRRRRGGRGLALRLIGERLPGPSAPRGESR